MNENCRFSIESQSKIPFFLTPRIPVMGLEMHYNASHNFRYFWPLGAPGLAATQRLPFPKIEESLCLKCSKHSR